MIQSNIYLDCTAQDVWSNVLQLCFLLQQQYNSSHTAFYSNYIYPLQSKWWFYGCIFFIIHISKLQWDILTGMIPVVNLNLLWDARGSFQILHYGVKIMIRVLWTTIKLIMVYIMPPAQPCQSEPIFKASIVTDFKTFTQVVPLVSIDVYACHHKRSCIENCM